MRLPQKMRLNPQPATGQHTTVQASPPLALLAFMVAKCAGELSGAVS